MGTKKSKTRSMKRKSADYQEGFADGKMQQVREAMDRDVAVRRDPRVRLFAAMLVERFGDLLQEISSDMAIDMDKDTPFQCDRNAALLLWMFYEFLDQRETYRDPNPYMTAYTRIAKPHQLSADHTAHWFKLERESDGWYKAKALEPLVNFSQYDPANPPKE